MKSSKRHLIQQLERIPMDPILREEVLAGVEGLDDSEAQEKAGDLKVALDRLPDLAERLRALRTGGMKRPAADSQPDAIQIQPSLSPREREIVQMVAKGYANKDIARILKISSTTVSTHLRHILEKLDKSSRATMIACLSKGLVDSGEGN